MLDPLNHQLSVPALEFNPTITFSNPTLNPHRIVELSPYSLPHPSIFLARHLGWNGLQTPFDQERHKYHPVVTCKSSIELKKPF